MNTPDQPSSLSLRARVSHGLKWSALGKFTGQALSWASTLLVIRLLSPQDYGLIAMAAVFINFCAMINEFGLGTALIQRQHVDNLAQRQVWTIALVANIAFYGLFYYAAAPIATFYEEPRLVPLVRVMALQFLIRAFIVVPHSMMIRRLRFKPIALTDLIGQVGNVVTTLTLAFLSFGYWSLIIGSLVEGLIRAPIYLAVSGFRPIPTRRTRGLKALLGLGSVFSANRLLWFLYSQMDKLILGKLLGAERLGVYSVGANLASIPLEKSGAILNQIALPAYSSLQKDPGGAYDAYVKTIRLILFFLVPICFGIAAIADEAILLILGEKWASAALPLALLSVITPLKLVSVSYSNLLGGLGHPLFVTKNLVYAFLIIVPSLALGSSWGLVGVCVAWVVAYPVWYVLTHYLVAKRLKWRFAKEFSNIMPPYLLGTAMLVTTDTGLVSLGILHESDLVNLALKVIVGVVTYMFLWLIFLRSQISFFRNEIRSLIRPATAG